jgi:hypothetical protein
MNRLNTVRFEPRYFALNLVWLNEQDIRSKPLLERRRMLRRFPRSDSYLLYVEHLEKGDGVRFFQRVCEQVQAVICKPKTSPYLLPGSRSRIPTTRRLSGARKCLIVSCRNDRTRIDLAAEGGTRSALGAVAHSSSSLHCGLSAFPSFTLCRAI